jgi:formate hydrogenlyase subunit 4
MIHEVMVLDHSGPDLGLIELGAFLKLFFFSAFAARLVCPVDTGHPLLDIGLFALALSGVYGTTGIVESVMARYRMDIVPRFLLVSFSLAFFAFVITLEMVK